jgi:predicted RNA-binding protein YlqC (UPF0109 family)
MSDVEYEKGDINVADDHFDDERDDVNQVHGAGGSAERTLNYLLDSIVEDKDAVFIDTQTRDDGTVVYEVHVAPDDVGKIIGRKGRVIQAMRSLVKAAGLRDGHRAHVEVDDK